MKFKILNITMAVLLLSTAIYTLFVFIPNTKEEVVNTQVYAISESDPVEVEYVNPLSNLLPLQENLPIVLEFEVINRELPLRWQAKKIYLKYTYLGEYTEDMVNVLNDLLVTDYKWQRQLDQNKDIVLGGPIFVHDDIYQLHTHNGLSLASKHYLFGDLLHLLYSQDQLEGTRIKVGETVLEAIWTKDAKVLEDNRTPSGAELVISTCLERNGDRRLISGWVTVLPEE